MDYNFTSKGFVKSRGNDTLIFTFNGHDKDCRDGYNQYGNLRISRNGINCGSYDSKSHVVNRSWEAYPHQTVYIDCVNQLLNYRVNLLEQYIIEKAGKKRMCKSLRADLEQLIQSDIICTQAAKVLEELRKC